MRDNYHFKDNPSFFIQITKSKSPALEDAMLAGLNPTNQSFNY